jgi:hypothetical protein
MFFAQISVDPAAPALDALPSNNKDAPLNERYLLSVSLGILVDLYFLFRI